MCAGFWTGNPHVASWFASVAAWWRGDPPRLLVAEKHPLPSRPIPGVVLRRATSLADLTPLPEFWYHWFSLSSRCRCVIPFERIRTAFETGTWEIFLACRESTGELIGTLVCRKLENLKIAQATWPRAAAVDYFCVHPAWRAKGVGRLLLTLLHNTRPAPVVPHLMFWEQAIHIQLPCFASGVFWAWKGSATAASAPAQQWQRITDPADRNRLWSACVPSGAVQARGGWIETEVWRGLEGSVAVWNTYHTSVPEGMKVGIVVGATSDQALTAFCASGAFGVVLRPADAIAPPEGWEFDAPYTWFAYNTLLGTGPGIGTFPCLAV